MINLLFTFKIIIIAVVAFLVITAWDEVLDRLIIEVFGLDRENIFTWILIAVIATLLLIVVLSISGVEAHDILGISETVDTQITGQTEEIVGGQVIHTNIR